MTSICTRCGKSSDDMVLVPDEGCVCPDCLLKYIKQLEAAIDTIKGAPMVRAVESLGLEFNVTGNNWRVFDPFPKDPVNPARCLAKNLAEALTIWRQMYSVRIEGALRELVENIEAQFDLNGKYQPSLDVLEKVSKLVQTLGNQEGADGEQQSQEHSGSDAST